MTLERRAQAAEGGPARGSRRHAFDHCHAVREHQCLHGGTASALPRREVVAVSGVAVPGRIAGQVDLVIGEQRQHHPSATSNASWMKLPRRTQVSTSGVAETPTTRPSR
jgi:hypothetical protein